MAAPPELFLANWISGSSTVKVVESMVVVVPLTVKSPDTITLPLKVALVSLIVTSVLPSAVIVTVPSEPVSVIATASVACRD